MTENDLQELQDLRQRITELEQRLPAAAPEPFDPEQALLDFQMRQAEERANEPFAMFAYRQGCEYAQVGGRMLFENGAQSNGVNRHDEPPDDFHARCALRLEFYRAKHAQKVRAYRSDREGIATQLDYHRQNFGPMPARGWEDHLRKLAAEIEELAAIIKELEAALPQTTTRDYVEEHKAAAAYQAAEAMSDLNTMPTY